MLWAPPPPPPPVLSPQPPRRGLHDKQPPLFSAAPPALLPCGPPRPQLSRSRHANFWLGTKGSARAGRVGASPPPSCRAARSLAACWKCLAGWWFSSPFPRRRRRCAAPRRPAREAPLKARERAARKATGRRAGAGQGAEGAGPGKRSD